MVVAPLRFSGGYGESGESAGGVLEGDLRKPGSGLGRWWGLQHSNKFSLRGTALYGKISNILEQMYMFNLTFTCQHYPWMDSQVKYRQIEKLIFEESKLGEPR